MAREADEVAGECGEDVARSMLQDQNREVISPTVKTKFPFPPDHVPMETRRVASNPPVTMEG